eukprot:SAG31_NODE_24987_length_470_cov_0.978437_2_plen_56_part_01
MKKTKYDALDMEQDDDWFLVVYEDGDQEELARHEVNRWLVEGDEVCVLAGTKEPDI